MGPIDYRRQAGRPGRNEPPAPVARIRTEIPKDMLAAAMRIAVRRKLTRQAAIREALAEWIERHEKASEAEA